MKSAKLLHLLTIFAILENLDDVMGYRKRNVQSGMCAAGHEADNSTRTCKPCPAGTFATEEMAHKNHACRPCYRIQQREMIKKNCTPTRNTVVVCERGYFMEHLSGEGYTCNLCWRCGLAVNEDKPHEVRACSSKGNTVCCEDKAMVLRDGQCVRTQESTTPTTAETTRKTPTTETVETTEEKLSESNFLSSRKAAPSQDYECGNNSYGQNCHFKCSDFCQQASTPRRDYCDRISGGCLFGCLRGYRGNNCTEKCPRKTYGQGCLLNCSQNCLEKDDELDDVCHHIHGQCLTGCQLGYEGVFCDIKSNLTLESSVYKYCLGGACGVILVLFIVLFTMCKLKKRRHRSKANVNDYNGTFVINDDHHEYGVPQSPALYVSEDRQKESSFIKANESEYITIDENFLYSEISNLNRENGSSS